MTTETVIAKIQLRRGDLDDLPVLDVAEFGYATDKNRLFIGNKPITFKGDGVTKEFNIRAVEIIPNQIRVLIDGNESYYDQIATPSTPGYTHSFEGTKLIFDRAPDFNADIVVSFNSEVRIFKPNEDKSVEYLATTPPTNEFVKSRINWDLLLYNTAKLTYSYKSNNLNFGVGEAFIIVDRDTNTIRVRTVSTDEFIQIGGMVEDGRFIVMYKNLNAPANLFYSLELWNTI